AAADRDLEALVAGERQGRGDVAGVGALGDHRRTALDHRVEDRAGVVVAGVALLENPAAEAVAEALDAAHPGTEIAVSRYSPWLRSEPSSASFELVCSSTSCARTASHLPCGSSTAFAITTGPRFASVYSSHCSGESNSNVAIRFSKESSAPDSA